MGPSRSTALRELAGRFRAIRDDLRGAQCHFDGRGSLRSSLIEEALDGFSTKWEARCEKLCEKLERSACSLDQIATQFEEQDRALAQGLSGGDGAATPPPPAAAPPPLATQRTPASSANPPMPGTPTVPPPGGGLPAQAPPPPALPPDVGRPATPGGTQTVQIDAPDRSNTTLVSLTETHTWRSLSLNTHIQQEVDRPLARGHAAERARDESEAGSADVLRNQRRRSTGPSFTSGSTSQPATSAPDTTARTPTHASSADNDAFGASATTSTPWRGRTEDGVTPGHVEAGHTQRAARARASVGSPQRSPVLGESAPRRVAFIVGLVRRITRLPERDVLRAWAGM